MFANWPEFVLGALRWLALLPIALLVLAMLGASLGAWSLRRTARDLALAACPGCGGPLGLRAVENGQAAWGRYVAKLFRERPAFYRLVARWPVRCVKCGRVRMFQVQGERWAEPDDHDRAILDAMVPSPIAPLLYLVAGEPSGDAHGAALLRALRERDPASRIAGRGGLAMRAVAGGALENWTDEAAVVGLWEVLKKYGWFRQQFRRVLGEIGGQNPAAVVLIDYPGFNLRLAKALRERNYGGKIVYYISPQVWAWHRGRIPAMARLLDLMICIFPFEQRIFEDAGLPTVFAGHPLVEQITAEAAGEPRDPVLVGLFPGSRGREVRKIFPVLLATARRLRRERPALRFAAPAASDQRAEELRLLAAGFPDVACEVLPPGSSRGLMRRASVGLVASGTATVEAALCGLSFAVVYRVAPLTYWVGRAVVRVPFLGMVNLLAEREIAREFIQGAAQPEAMAAEVRRLLEDPAARAHQTWEMAAVTAKLGHGAGASANAAGAILGLLGR